MVKNSFVIASVFYLAIFCSFTSVQGTEINKTYPGKEFIELKAILGSCKVIKSEDNKIHINLMYTFKDEEYKAGFTENQNNILLKEEFLEKSPVGFSRWTIAIPEDTRILFNSGTGNFTVEGVRAEFKAETGTGSINVEHSVGQFELTSGTGNVNGKDMTIEGSCKFTSGTGNVNIAISGNINFDILVASGMGDAILDCNASPLKGCYEFTAKQGSGRIESPFKFEKEEITSDEHFKYEKKSFCAGDRDTPRIHIETGFGQAKLIK